MPAYHARVALEAHQSPTNALIVTVLHVEADVLSSPPNWGNIATDLWTWLGPAFTAMASINDVFDQLVVTDENYPGSTFGQGVHVIGTAGARALTDTKLDAALCTVISWRTAVAKRYARGHTFAPPAYTSTALGPTSNWASAAPYWIAVNDFAAGFQAGHVAGSTSYIPEVFSRHQVALNQTPFSFPITGHQVSSKQHWLRSRSTSP